MSANPRTSLQENVKIGVNIHHRDGAPPTVDYEVHAIILDRTQGGEDVELVWTCDTPGKNFFVCFPTESPFKDRHFHNGKNSSGTIMPGASGRYKYNIEIDGHVLDPTVIIKP